MSKNMGNADRIIRAVVALAALWVAYAAGFGSVPGIIAIIVAIIMAVTAAVGVCPLYRLIGVNTCPANQR